MKRLLIYLGALTLLTGVLTALNATSATAISGPAICGSGSYKKIRALPIKNANGNKIGRVVVSKNKNSNVYCGVTIKSKKQNKRHPMSIELWIDVGDPSRPKDSGNFYTHAGPVYKTWNRSAGSSNLVITGSIKKFTTSIWCDKNHCGYGNR